ncbi:MAG: DHH family phosphoesterase [Campylobacterales bacterium]
MSSVVHCVREADQGLYRRHVAATGRRYLSALAAKRGIDDLERFLSDDLSKLTSWQAIRGINEAKNLILEALRKNPQTIAIHSDYDADGLMGAYTFLTFVKRKFGIQLKWYVNHREKEGYGLQPAAVEKMASEGISLIITIDNGITAHEAIAYAAKLGITVILTDHHEPKIDQTGNQLLPPAAILLCHKIHGILDRAVDWCGAAMAWQLCRAIDEELGLEFIDAIALATVADMVSLADPDNRLIVKAGLKKMQEGSYSTPALGAFLEALGFGAGRSFDEEDISFQIAPVINSAGRFSRAAELLAALLDPASSVQSFAPFITLNEERKRLTSYWSARAEEIVATMHDQPFLVVCLNDAPEGLAGLIASRLENHYLKPTFVFVAKDGGWIGSGRARNFDLQLIFHADFGMEIKGGGHKEACGLRLPDDASLERFEKLLNRFQPEPLKLWVDGHLHAKKITKELATELSLLRPYGAGFEKPLFLIEGENFGRVQIFKEQHLSFQAEEVRFVCFNYQKRHHQLSCERLDRFLYKGMPTLQRFREEEYLQVIVNAVVER